MGGKSSAPPPAPNYSQIAGEQAVLDRNALTNTTYSNRPNQNSPWGSTTWGTQAVRDPATGEMVTRWTQNDKLDSRLQAGLNNQFGMIAGRSGMAQNKMGELGASMAPVDYNQFRDVANISDPMEFRQASEDAAYGRSTSRLDPQYEQAAKAMEVKMRNQGLRPGDEAYDAAMGNFDRAKNDAYAGARQDATQAGRAEAELGFGQQLSNQLQSSNLRQIQIAEFLRQRGQPLSDINDLLAGQGIQPAQQSGFQSAGATSAPNMMGAAQQQYGAQQDAWSARQAQRNSANAGMMGMVGTLGSAAMMSDRRLKRDIVRIGTWLGYPLYHFFYVWGEAAIGIMSDEVNQDAVFTHPSGFDMVDYSAVRAA